MLWILFHESSSTNSLIYRDESEQVLVDCSSNIDSNVFIPQSVTEIFGESSENYAFRNCKSSIKTLQFAENSQVVSIGLYSFYDTILESVNLSECKNLNYLNESVFESCRLRSIILPPHISKIGEKCFRFCGYIISIQLPNEIIYIGGSAFRGCVSLASIEIPEKVIEIGRYAFESCTYLTNVIIANRVTKIGYFAFGNCVFLRSIIIPENVTEIRGAAFFFCQALSNIEIKGKLMSINPSTFYRCTLLKSIKIPESVTIIDTYAFRLCKN